MWNIPAGRVFEDIQVVVPYVMHDVVCYDSKGKKN